MWIAGIETVKSTSEQNKIAFLKEMEEAYAKMELKNKEHIALENATKAEKYADERFKPLFDEKIEAKTELKSLAEEYSKLESEYKTLSTSKPVASETTTKKLAETAQDVKPPKNKTLALIAAGVLLVGGGIGAYFYSQNKKTSK